MDPQLARRIYEDYFAADDDHVEEIIDGGAQAIVRTDGIPWRIIQLERVRYAPARSGYELFEARPDVQLEEGGNLDGVALLPDGMLLHLNDAMEFQLFWAMRRDVIAPLELAALLTRYQAGEPSNQHLIRAAADLEAGAQVQAQDVPGFTAPMIEREGGALRIAFCTYYVYRDERNIPRFGVQRWDVQSDADGRLSWTQRELARGIAYRRG